MRIEDRILAAILLFLPPLLPNEPAIRYLRVKAITGNNVTLRTSSFDLYLAMNNDSVRGEISRQLSEIIEYRLEVVTDWEVE